MGITFPPFFWHVLGAVGTMLSGLVFILSIYIIPDTIMRGLEKGRHIGDIIFSESIPIYGLILIAVSGTALVIIARRFIRYILAGIGKS